MPNFKGYIHDVGGPTANFRHPSCTKQLEHGLCKGKKCLAPPPLVPLWRSTTASTFGILRKLRAVEGGKRSLSVRIRYDYLLLDKDDTFLKELVKYHVSGQLKVAPNIAAQQYWIKWENLILKATKEFSRRYFEATGQAHKEQYLVPYLMSSIPGSTLKEAIELALFLKTGAYSSAAGAGFLSYSRYHINLYVLYRA